MTSLDTVIGPQLQAMHEHLGLHEIRRWQHLRISGSDHVDFLHRMATNSIASCDVGRSVEAIFADARGRILELAGVHRIEPDCSWLILGPGESNELAAWLDRYLFSEVIQFHAPGDGDDMIEVIGPSVPAALSSVIPEIREEMGICGTTQTGLVYQQETWAQLPVCRVAGPTEAVATLRRDLLTAGAVPVGETAWQLQRIATVTPMRGAELTDAHNPWEAGLAHAVDLHKGCYIGQEVIARLEAYDKIKQCLAGVDLTGSVAAGTRLLQAGRDVGYVSSVAARPDETVIGLGYIRLSAARPDQQLEVDGGGSATVRQVVSLPE